MSHHLGLFLEKSLPHSQFATDGRFAFSDSEKQRLPDSLKHPLGVQDSAATVRAVKRRTAMVDALGGRASRFQFKTTERLVTGTGISSPLENGLYIDWTTGAPVLPGAGLKGMARTYAEREFDPINLAEEEDREIMSDIIASIFGVASDDDGFVGEIAFLDGLLLEAEIKLDVMTPHYGDWYRDRVAPGDWMSPNPISFLVVEKGASLDVLLLARDEPAAGLLPMAGECVRGGLKILGAGAKTAKGFGRAAST